MLFRSVWMVGIDPESDGLKRAREMGIKTTSEGVDGLLPHVIAAEVAQHQSHMGHRCACTSGAIDLLTVGMGEAFNLAEKEMLNEVSRKGQLERKQQEAQFTRDTLTNVPVTIYIM